MSETTLTKFYRAVNPDGSTAQIGTLSEIGRFTGTGHNAVTQAFKRKGKSNGYKIELLPYKICLDCRMIITDINRYEHKAINRCKYCYLNCCRERWNEEKDFKNEKRRYVRKKPKHTTTCPICKESFETARQRQFVCSKESCQKEYHRIQCSIYRRKKKK